MAKSEKSLVFISHIGDEKDIAMDLKELIEDNFLGMIEVFVSSDGDSIGAGQRWLDSITSALKQCSVEIVLASPYSIQRPWINFEAGAGWVQDVPVIPICHSGMTPTKLPVPLNMLQAVTVSEVSGLKLLFTVLAKQIDAKEPKIDFTDFLEKVSQFEDKYTFWTEVNEKFEQLDALNSSAVKTLLDEEFNKVSGEFDVQDKHELDDLAAFFEEREILSIKGDGSFSMGPGMRAGYVLQALNNFDQVITDSRFVFYRE